MPRKESKAVPEGNNLVPQQEEFGSGEPTLADVYRRYQEEFKKMDSYFDRWNRKLDEISDEMRVMDQHVPSLEQDARQPRLAMEADGPTNKKTRERTEGTATAVQAMHGDSCSTDRVDPDPMCSTSFGGDCTGPPAPPCSALVDNRAAAPKSCLPFLETHSPTAAGGLPPTGEASTGTKTTFNQPPLRFYSPEETD